MEEDHAQEPETVETVSNEFNLLLDEITARCKRQTKEINKWLLYTKDFKQTIANTLNTLEQEKLEEQRADIALKWTPRTPRTPRTPMTTRAVRTPQIHK